VGRVGLPSRCSWGGDQAVTQAVPREGGVDLGVHHHDDAGLGQVLDEPGAPLAKPQLVAPLLPVVDDTGFGLHRHHLTIRAGSCDLAGEL
jgi:hypothetical protein